MAARALGLPQHQLLARKFGLHPILDAPELAERAVIAAARSASSGESSSRLKPAAKRNKRG